MYIDTSYVRLALSTDQVNNILAFGNTPTGSYDAKLQMYIDQASSMVDSFLVPAGYPLPLASIPESIKSVTLYITLQKLYGLNDQPMPEVFGSELQSGLAYLTDLKEKRLQLYPLEQDTTTGTGGNVFDFNLSYPNQPKRIFDMRNARGTIV